jgi:hypothetical protein
MASQKSPEELVNWSTAPVPPRVKRDAANTSSLARAIFLMPKALVGGGERRDTSGRMLPRLDRTVAICRATQTVAPC